MGMTTYVVGIKPADEKYRAMYAVVEACREAGVKPPDDVRAFFGGPYDYENADGSGVSVQVKARKHTTDTTEGYEVDLRELDPDIKILRLCNSW